MESYHLSGSKGCVFDECAYSNGVFAILEVKLYHFCTLLVSFNITILLSFLFLGFVFSI